LLISFSAVYFPVSSVTWMLPRTGRERERERERDRQCF